MQNTVREEVQQLATAFKGNHAEAIMSLACLVELNTNLLRAFGERHNVSVQSMLDLQQSMVQTWLASRTLNVLDLDHARAELQRAGLTANYIASLPA